MTTLPNCTGVLPLTVWVPKPAKVQVLVRAAKQVPLYTTLP